MQTTVFTIKATGSMCVHVFSTGWKDVNNIKGAIVYSKHVTKVLGTHIINIPLATS